MRDTNPTEYRPQAGALYRCVKGGFLASDGSYSNDAMVIRFYSERFGPIIGRAVLTNAAVHALIYGEPK